MKKHFSSIILVFVFFVGLSVLLYPGVSDYVNSRTQSRAVANYDKTIESYTKDDSDALFKAAKDYNERLWQTKEAFYDPSSVKGYRDTLDISGTGIMGYVTIPKIKVELPVYHGTDEGVLNVAAGHLEGTSLPVGGENTHCVLSAHRGLPSAQLFTNLDKLEVGDTFTITVLDQILTYEVDQIRIVKPDEVEELQIEEGKDYCTLMTCTPYGINTHRLLVRGKRVDNAEDGPHIRVTAEAYKIDPLIVMPAVAAPILLLLLIYLLLHYRRKKK